MVSSAKECLRNNILYCILHTCITLSTCILANRYRTHLVCHVYIWL